MLLLVLILSQSGCATGGNALLCDRRATGERQARDRRATGARQAGDRRATGARQAGDRRATGERQARDRRATVARQAGMPFSATIQLPYTLNWITHGGRRRQRNFVNDCSAASSYADSATATRRYRTDSATSHCERGFSIWDGVLVHGMGC